LLGRCAKCAIGPWESICLEFVERGAISKLRFASSLPAFLKEPGDVMVHVEASALNFRDVLNVLGMYPGDAGKMGLEFAGTVVEAENSPDFCGTSVMGLASNCFASRVQTKRDFVVIKPDNLSVIEAAAVPLVFCTALAVMEEARLRGKSVLVHAAAGGVGSAASQLAQKRFGAGHVFGTAGEGAKKQFAQQWGAKVVFGSRDTHYSEHVLEATGGAGVDCVLNSLTGGDFVERTMACMSEVGHWSEIGKRGILSHESFAKSRPRGKYHVYDLGDDMREAPKKVQRLLETVARDLEQSILSAVTGTVFPLRKAKEAFQFMFDGKHVGKIVFEHPVVRTSSMIVVSGAFGGLGKEFSKGVQATRLLLGRRGLQTARDKEIVGSGTQICSACDVARVEETCAAVRAGKECSGAHGTITVLHLAGTLKDGLLKDLGWQAFDVTVRPKVAGLRSLTLAVGDETADFVLFSSVTALIGNVGQTNYGAANGFLDGFAERSGNAVSVNWGAWEVGMYAQQDERLKVAGRGLEPSQAQDLLGKAQSGGHGSSFGIIRMNWNSGVKTQTTRYLRISKGTKQQEKKQGASVEDVFHSVSKLTREVLGVEADAELDENAPLRELGFDSMMSVELRRKLSEALGVDLPATLLFDYPTLAKMQGRVLELTGAIAQTQGEGKDRLLSVKASQTVVVSGTACRFGSASTWQEFAKIVLEGADVIQ
jgi:NADPH:quinone reductase-like Zn-dependent oxidoreductase/acyl carrier protein